ncbi:MAG: hypothetical protein AB1568_05625 [Thermodesulfobacteriota bacterium]
MEEGRQDLKTYLAEHYEESIFSKRAADGDVVLHLHGGREVTGRLREIDPYSVAVEQNGVVEECKKLDIKFLYPADQAESVRSLLTVSARVRDLRLEPILARGKRHHVKNRTLFPLMQERAVLLFTTLEGEELRGIVGAIRRYEFVVLLKGGIPVTLMRHALYDVRDKKKKSLLKAVVEPESLVVRPQAVGKGRPVQRRGGLK